MNHEHSKTFRPSLGQRIMNWFDARRGGLGYIAFALNRITGIGLVVYLGLHLVVLSQLATGKIAYNSFVELASSPLLKLLDVVLIAGILIHGLNGLRVALVGMGYNTRIQKPAFLVLMAIALVLLVYTTARIFAS
jgi:succinate dehydrogenase / fumarate reductase, cytochrome b subunit